MQAAMKAIGIEPGDEVIGHAGLITRHPQQRRHRDG